MRFIYTTPNGGVAIVEAAPREILEPLIGKRTVAIDGIRPIAGQPKLSEEDYRAHVIARAIPSDATNVQELPSDWSAPPDRTFRGAWVQSGKVISIDMLKAREIHRANLRQLRSPLLAVLDAAYLQADEQGDLVMKAAIAAKKQALRDAPSDPQIEQATTPDELKAVIPDALKGIEKQELTGA